MAGHQEGRWEAMYMHIKRSDVYSFGFSLLQGLGKSAVSEDKDLSVAWTAGITRVRHFSKRKLL